MRGILECTSLVLLANRDRTANVVNSLHLQLTAPFLEIGFPIPSDNRDKDSEPVAPLDRIVEPGEPWHGVLPRERAIDRTVRFLRYSLQLVQSTNNTAVNKVQLWMAEEMDYRSPLREFAPSRAIVRAHFTATSTPTVTGFFSALVFRLITYNSRALRQTDPTMRKVLFHSLGEWDQYLQYLRNTFADQHEDFFCNPKAIGGHPLKRSPSHAAHYWEAAQILHAQLWPLSETPTFSQCQDALSALKKKHSVPQFGALTTYLLATDLVYATVVQMPTLQEVGRFIHEFWSGGIRGLQILGYLPYNAPNPGKVRTEALEEVVTAFSQFFSDVGGMLTEEERKGMGWDPIVAEHTLCKISRCYSSRLWSSV